MKSFSSKVEMPISDSFVCDANSLRDHIILRAMKHYYHWKVRTDVKQIL